MFLLLRLQLHSLLLGLLCVGFGLSSKADVDQFSAGKKSKNIVILHSYDKEYWTDQINQGILNTARSLGLNIHLSSLYFNAVNVEFQQKRNEAKAAQKMAAEAIAMKPDLILVADDEIAKFVMPELYKSDIPVVFTGVNEARDEISWLQNISKDKVAGILETYPVNESLDMLKKLKPSIKKMSILTSETVSSVLVANYVKSAMKKIKSTSEKGVSLDRVVLSSDWATWKKQLLEIQKTNDAFWVLVPYGVKDTDNKGISVFEMGRWITDNIKIPAIGIISIHTRIGLLSSISATPYGIGRQTCELAFRFFSGEKLSRIGIEDLRYHEFEINKSEAQRRGIQIPESLNDIAHLIEGQSEK